MKHYCHFWSLSKILFVQFIFRKYLCGDSAARRKPRGYLHPSRFALACQIIQYIICQRLVKDTFVPIALHIEFQTLQLYAKFIGTVFDNNLTEVRLSGFWADARKLRAVDCNCVVPLRAGVVEQFELWLFTHFRPRKNSTEPI